MRESDTEKKEKLLTVIIPVYNAELYLERCLDSVLSQKYMCMQIILVDDGSMDGSALICDSYAQKDNRIMVIHTPNCGVVAARKRALAEAKGDYVCFVDSDDHVDKDMYSTLVSVMNKTNSDFVHSGYKEIHGNRTTERNSFPYKSYEFNDTNERIEFLKKRFLDIKNEQTISYSIWSKIFKRELIEKCFGELDDEQQIGEDALCLCRCIMESKRVTVIPDCFYNYIVRDESLSHMLGDLNVINHIMLCANLIKMLRKYKDDESLINEMTEFCLSTILPFVKQNRLEREYIKQFYLDDIKLLRGKRIVLYGGGKVGRDILAQLECQADVEIVCWVDRKFTDAIDENGVSLVNPDNITDQVFDMVFIAISDGSIADEIKDELAKIGVDRNKVLWQKPGRFF